MTAYVFKFYYQQILRKICHVETKAEHEVIILYEFGKLKRLYSFNIIINKTRFTLWQKLLLTRNTNASNKSIFATILKTELLSYIRREIVKIVNIFLDFKIKLIIKGALPEIKKK